MDNDMKIFRCIHSDQIIQLSKYNDSKCDCCDGSDEIENVNVHCKNTCPVNLSFFTDEIKNLFQNSIQQSIYNIHRVDEVSQIYEDVKRKLRLEQLYVQNLYQSSIINTSILSSRILNETSACLGIHNMTEYMDKKYTQFFKIAVLTLNLTKMLCGWEEEKAQIENDLYKKVLLNAYRTLNFTYMIFFSNLLVEKENLIHQSAKYESEYSRLGYDLMNFSSFMKQFLSGEREWLDYATRNVTISYPCVEGSITLNNIINLTYSEFNQTTNFNLTYYGKNLIYESEENQKIILKPMCYDRIRGFSIHPINENVSLAEFGSPIACPTEYSDENFIEFIRNLQFYG
ncbi:hypothetical protein TVAG_494930 [Trichomonas vaginalis G3]|uniref:Glucosidase II beta subunit N-terminal domain-containing protein n=1 Tax=Trichomonas vaginalis (strain ATCC PRA-98 / G3) TaxID=412133 RepID=A2EXU0_TRIV3|nr:hypothetical protein TVAGG3_0653960 [Trichomonas vaginalis G3]EAY02544.1 hypothetical protein TVAG_494930 [Trichomonas vaginalis G3]KAI5506036.1 hypothetical protein TVAGG3_0653960 [Trichomonas vaginalis G3]|eukprot:XP_001314783.1 hypothetical protein [Trichomonas vaginalis G3]